MRPDDELKQLMAAARTNANDLASPEFARLATALADDSQCREAFERSQAFDRRLASVFADVEVPSGLADKILAHVLPDVRVAEKPADPKRGLSRRGWLALAGLGATAAAVAIVARPWFTPSTKNDVSKGELASRVDSWLSRDWSTSWSDNVAAAQIAGKPVKIDQAIAVKPRRWQALEDNQGELAVFDLSSAGQAEQPQAPAMLFAMPTEVTHQIPAFPTLPMPKLPTSGALATSAWQRDGYVYVLAVEESGQKLDDFINEARLALAMR